MPCAAANASARCAERDPTATSSAPGTCTKSPATAAAMPPVAAMPQRMAMPAALPRRRRSANPARTLARARLDPGHARVVGEPVREDRAQDDERREVEDPPAVGDARGEDEQREGHRGHALGAEPGHE